MKLKLNLLFAFLTGLLITIGGSTAVAKQAATSTPTALRGTWTQYHPSEKSYTVVQIKPHSISYHLEKNGKRVGGKPAVFTFKSKGYHQLNVKRFNHPNAQPSYQLNTAHHYYEKLPQMWIGHQTIKGHRYRVLKTYEKRGHRVGVFTPKKMTVDATYDYGTQKPASFLGH
ncbi:hypothetical protein [Levilactobacillus enshiensis]|uniref:hypothetical protein n=1 Tax=Levilactobacillus enshiensis TaxID=2590213 RepID=UPI001179D7E2|nr:hypothetical protein [Levilactobacillus enshiensis]